MTRRARRNLSVLLPALLIACAIHVPAHLPAQVATADSARLAALKREAVAEVERMRDTTQQIVDMLFSFGELGFQEHETSRYLSQMLEKSGFRVERGISGIPTAWMATWGSGDPVIALGSDIDGIPQSSQKPGVAYHDPVVAGAPGHGEGHNSGHAVLITAALALKRIMEREEMPGTIKIWPGVAEEILGAKAHFVRDGFFKDVDVTIFSHVASNLGVSYGPAGGTGLVSVLYTFEGVSAHSAGAPWRGRSALDAVELMNIGWNFRREHLGLSHRSHYVIPDGGDQPNVVPRTASVWYFFREVESPDIRTLWAVGDSMAAGAAMMTGTRLTGMRVLGSAWPRHFNKPVAVAMDENIKVVGMPEWSDADQTLARAVQRELGNARTPGLDTALSGIGTGTPSSQNRGGGSDDIGDISWVTPTVTLRYPSNIPGLPGHDWSSAIAMATPIAHKGATAGAKVTAMTMLDLLLQPALVDSAWSYFREQTAELKYEPLMRPQDEPPIEWNAEIMDRFRPEMRKFYYDPSRYGTYLEQLGIEYPTVRADSAR